jgi:hypothetical protein
VTGQRTLREETNRNGELLREFAYANNMAVMSTNFQHKRIHKITWLSPDQNTESQIDHIIINANKKGVTEDVHAGSQKLEIICLEGQNIQRLEL